MGRLAALSCVLLVGCPRSFAGVDGGGGRSDAPPVPVPDAPIAPVPDSPLPSGTLAYVVSALDTPEVDASGLVVGVNVDGAIGTGTSSDCTDALDYRSPISGAPDVDNQWSANVVGLFGGMLPTTFARAFEERFAAGADLLVLEVSGVGSFTSDPSVGVRAFLGRTADGRPPRLVAGRLAPGQAFVEVTSLGRSEGYIDGGRLHAGFDRYEVTPGFADGTPLPLQIRELRFSAAISPTALTRGEMGGHQRVASIVELAAGLGSGIDEATVRSVTQPDLLPDPSRTICDGISIGLSFEAVQAFVR